MSLNISLNSTISGLAASTNSALSTGSSSSNSGLSLSMPMLPDLMSLGGGGGGSGLGALMDVAQIAMMFM